MTDPHVSLTTIEGGGRAIVTRSGDIVPIEDISEALALLEDPELRAMLTEIVQKGVGERLHLLVEALQIETTKSVFTSNPKSVEVLEDVARRFPFSYWLENMGVPLTSAKREHLLLWWKTFMLMASEAGYLGVNSIDTLTRKVNLWAATGPLAEKMRRDAPRYRFMPALLINHPQQVERLLKDIDEPEPFIEVLVGERFEDLRASEVFLGAFSTVIDEGGEVLRTISHTLFSVSLALARE